MILCVLVLLDSLTKLVSGSRDEYMKDGTICVRTRRLRGITQRRLRK